MPGVSKYEREQIDALLQGTPGPPIEPGSGLAIFDVSDIVGRFVYDAAIAAAMRSAGLNLDAVGLAFSDESSLATVTRAVQSAKVIVVDVSSQNPSIYYCLGLANARGRWGRAEHGICGRSIDRSDSPHAGMNCRW